MASMLIDSLKRLYDNGLKGKSPSLTKDRIKERVSKGTITEADYKYITGEDYE